MSWTLRWSFVAEHRDIFDIHWRTAARICAALFELEKTGRGSLTRIEPDDPNRYKLRVTGAEAQIFLDTKARVIYVVRIRGRA